MSALIKSCARVCAESHSDDLPASATFYEPPESATDRIPCRTADT